MDNLEGAMAEEDYEPWGEYGIPGRRFFVMNRGPVRTNNVHVFEAGTPEVERHLAFRDYLIQHPETAEAYGDSKMDPAEKFPTDIEAYMDGEDALIRQTESEALSWNRTPGGVS